MNRLQKMARFRLKIIAFSIAAGVVVGLVLAIGGNEVLAMAGGGFVLAIGVLFACLSHVFVRKEKDRISYDERDSSIQKKAYMTGYGALWCIFIIICMIPIPPFAMPMVLTVTLAFIKSIEAFVVLANYGWGGKENE